MSTILFEFKYSTLLVFFYIATSCVGINLCRFSDEVPVRVGDEVARINWDCWGRIISPATMTGLQSARN